MSVCDIHNIISGDRGCSKKCKRQTVICTVFPMCLNNWIFHSKQHIFVDFLCAIWYTMLFFVVDIFHSFLCFFFLSCSLYSRSFYQNTYNSFIIQRNLICCPNIWRRWITHMIWNECNTLSFVVIFDTSFSYKIWSHHKINSIPLSMDHRNVAVTFLSMFD